MCVPPLDHSRHMRMYVCVCVCASPCVPHQAACRRERREEEENLQQSCLMVIMLLLPCQTSSYHWIRGRPHVNGEHRAEAAGAELVFFPAAALRSNGFSVQETMRPSDLQAASPYSEVLNSRHHSFCTRSSSRVFASPGIRAPQTSRKKVRNTYRRRGEGGRPPRLGRLAGSPISEALFSRGSVLD